MTSLVQAVYLNAASPSYAAIVAYQAHATLSLNRREEEPIPYQEVIPEVGCALDSSFDVLLGVKRRFPMAYIRRPKKKKEVKRRRPLSEGSIGLLDVLV
ncbi:MAG: hypothetical protein WC796_04475 [Candidatus Pacearchaeota archaeon]|jgi:hypothetical protein